MKLTMHRGPGGNAISLMSGDTFILISSGTLPAGSSKVDAILVPHFDAALYGLSKDTDRSIPVYTSKGAAAFMKTEKVFDNSSAAKIDPVSIIPRKKFRVGAFTVTPHLVDFFAFDALAFSVEADGKKLFVTMDARGHARRSGLFKRITANPAEGVDCLIMGTGLAENSETHYPQSKGDQDAMEAALAANNSAVLIKVRTEDIAALAEIYKACRKARRILVICLRMAFTLSLLRNVSDKIPQPHWPNVRVKFSGEEAAKLQASGYRELVHFIGSRKIDVFEMRRKHSKLAFLLSAEDTSKGIIKDLGDAGGTVEIEYVPPDAPVTREEIRELALAMRPKTIVSGFADASEIFAPTPVTMLGDGESVEI